MEKPRPLIIAALLCERVLQETNGTISVIRIADRVSYNPALLPPGTRPAITLSGLISIKSGPVTGEFSLKIFIENPAGKRAEAFAGNLKLSGKDQGQNIVLNLTMGAEVDGLHWFDVVFDDQILTRIPLMVVQEVPEKSSEHRP
jgi:hypothetical protein